MSEDNRAGRARSTADGALRRLVLGTSVFCLAATLTIPPADNVVASTLCSVEPLAIQAEAVISPPEVGADFGRSISSAGDVNGDGHSDILVGAPDAGPNRRGRVYLYLGGNHSISTIPAWSAGGSQDNERFGTCVSGRGDVNQDGFPDLVVGAPEFNGSGRILVFLGDGSSYSMTPAQTIVGGRSGAQFGFSAAIVGDANADGYDDVVVGSPQFAAGQVAEGRAQLYLGGAAGLQTVHAWAYESNAPGASFGFCVTNAGDLDKDGRADVAIGAPGFDRDRCGVIAPCPDAGRLYVFGGDVGGLRATPGFEAYGSAAVGGFGTSIAGGGDFNGDGWPDLVVGSPRSSFDSGKITLYPGSATGMSTGPYVVGPWIAGRMGSAVAFVGDLNEDGRDDVGTGAPRRMFIGVEIGSVLIYQGCADGQFGEPTILSGNSGVQFGRTLAGTGDANNTCVGDFIASAIGGNARFVDGESPCPMTDVPAAVSFVTVPTGLPILIDDVEYTTPVEFGWQPGESHTVFAPDPPPGVDHGYRFVGWKDLSGAGRSRSISVGYWSAKTFEAEYLQAFPFNTGSVANGVVQTFPYASGAFVSPRDAIRATAIPHCGYYFNRWLVAGTTAFDSTGGGSVLDIAATDGPFELGAEFLPYATGFSDVTPASMRDGVGAQRVAWGDYDGDGDDDVFVSSYGQFPLNGLYENAGDGLFTKITSGPWSSMRATRMGAWGDFDNDGDRDLVLVGDAIAQGPNAQGGVRLCRNEGGIQFVDATPAVLTGAASIRAGGWGDLDGDGDLDLLLLGSGTTNRILSNEGGGTFSEISPGALGSLSAWGATFCDFDADGDPDIACATSSGSALYTNEENWGFSPVIDPDLSGSASAISWADFDQDGDMDMFVAAQPVSRLLMNDPTGWSPSPASFPGGQDAAWEDFDLDGDLDLYLAAGSADRLFLNDGNGFSESGGPCGPSPGLSVWDFTVGSGWSDMDSDGDPDLLVVRERACCFTTTPNFLWRNDAPPGRHWLSVKLIGTTTNRDAFGARIQLFTSAGPQTREILALSGSGSQSSAVAHFGLGAESSVDSIVVTWPSGVVQRETALQVDRTIRLWEPLQTIAPAGSEVAIAWSSTVTGEIGLVEQPGSVQLLRTELTPPVPTGNFDVLPSLDPMYFEVRSEATYGERAKVRIEPDTTFGAGSEDVLRVLHYDPASDPPGWTDVTTESGPGYAVGSVFTLGPIALARLYDLTDAPSGGGSASRIGLGPPAPNPFRESTDLTFSLSTSSRMTLDVLDLAGRRIRRLVNGVSASGRQRVRWDGLDDARRAVSDGVYFVVLRVERASPVVRRVVLLR